MSNTNPKYEEFYSYSDDQLRRKGKTEDDITAIRREQWPDAAKEQIAPQTTETAPKTADKTK